MVHEEERKIGARKFYIEALEALNETGIEYLIGGAFALHQHTGLERDTKDLDIFCRAGEYLKILKIFNTKGYNTELTDARWIAKAFKENHYIDIIFSTVNNLCPVDQSWFDHSIKADFFGIPVNFIAPEELIWCKIYVQNRDHYDAADINHIILKKGKDIDWKRLMSRLDQHWHLLLGQFLNFQFVYPSERDMVPKWLFDELLERAREQYEVPAPVDKVCRGPLIEHTEYNSDITDLGYKIITCKRL